MTAAANPAPLAADWFVELQAIRQQLDALQARVVREDPVDTSITGFSSSTREWVRQVMGLVVEEFCVPLSELAGPSRHADFIRPRFALMWLLSHASNYNRSQVARLVKRGDHSCVTHAMRRVDGWRANDAAFRTATDALLSSARELRDIKREVIPEPAAECAHSTFLDTQRLDTQRQGAQA